MANINHKWDRICVVSCTHAKYVDKQAFAELIKFRDRWCKGKNDVVAHIGDWVDLTALMSSGAGEGEPLAPDVDTGLTHLRMYRPNLLMAGNHEARSYHLRNSNKATTAWAAHKIVEAMEECAQKLKAPLLPYRGAFETYRVADCLLTHGSVYGEQSCRDMAEMYCTNDIRKVIFGHTHRTGMASARTMVGGTAYNIGSLTKRASLEYSLSRRATFSWQLGFAWGEVCRSLNQSQINIATCEDGGSFRLPV